MMIAQFIIVTPIIIALSKQTLDVIYSEYKDFIISLKLNTFQSIILLVYDTRHLLVVTGLAGLGRALAEVGAVMIVGGKYCPSNTYDDYIYSARNIKRGFVKSSCIGFNSYFIWSHMCHLEYVTYEFRILQDRH